MNLSNRAEGYLARAKRKESIRDEDDIRKAFELQNIEPSARLVDFQKRFGGFTAYACLEPIVYGILHKNPSRGDFTNLEGKLIIYEPDEEIKERHFVCADTRYQLNFTIDEEGKYFEDFELKCNHFETWVEEFAMLELANKGKWKSIYKYDLYDLRRYEENIERNKIEELRKYLNLKRVEGFPEDIISWETNGQLLVWEKPSSIKILSENGADGNIIEHIKNIFEV